jgi:hypothetical protein
MPRLPRSRVSATVPVAYFAHSRADLVVRTLAALRENGVTLIYAFADGARSPEGQKDVDDVRRILRSVDWADLHLVERPVNVGIDAGIVAGISETLGAHQEVVVCEDDIEMSPGTYEYFVAALERYRDEPRVMCISGWTHPRVTPAGARAAPHFTGRFPCWGWATWRRAWAGFPGMSAVELRDRCLAAGIDIGKYGEDVPAIFAGDAAKATWDYCFSLHMMLHGGLSLLPRHTLTAHIGYDARATHPQNDEGWEDHPESPPPPDQVRWPAVREEPDSAECWRRALNAPPRPSVVARIRRRLARLIATRAGREPRA